MKRWQLEQMQSLPLELKIKKTILRVREYYEYYNGEVYISFSGGKDSTVLLDIVRSVYPNVKAVFIDTGLEFPEIRKFVKTIGNVTWLKPKIPFPQVIKKYGYPVVSKEQSQYIYQFKHAKSQKTKDTRINGNKWGRGKISGRWIKLINAPFDVSDQCCNIMKKNPAKLFEKETELHPIIGTMTEESNQRLSKYLISGCNSFELKRPVSKPLSFWKESDIWNYIKTKNLPYSKIYDMGYKRTGCMFCMYGCHLEDYPNRFQKMQHTHPKQYNYCMNELGLKEVLKYCNISYEDNQIKWEGIVK